MSLRFVDLTHPLMHGQPSFPGDPALSIVPHCTIATRQCNVSEICFGSHQGTHLDAMFHFVASGKTLDQMPLEWFYGPARLLRIPKRAGEEIGVEDFEPYERHLVRGARILYTTGWHEHFGAANYFTDFPSLTLEAGRYLAARQIRLLGMDTPTPSRQGVEMHQLLLARETEMVLVESLANLDALPDEFLFVSFPLNFKGRDGSPIRAVAVCESER